MTFVSKMLIGAAGNAGGGAVGWISKVVPQEKQYQAVTRVCHNPTNANIFVAFNDGSVTTAVGLDYDGNFLRSSRSQGTTVGEGHYRCDVRPYNEQNIFITSYTNAGYRYNKFLDSGLSFTTTSGVMGTNLTSYTPTTSDANYKFFYIDTTISQWKLKFAKGGQQGNYYTGYGSFYRSLGAMFRATIESAGLISVDGVALRGGFTTNPGTKATKGQVAKGQNNINLLCYQDEAPQWRLRYRTTTDANFSLYDVGNYSVPSANSDFWAAGLFVDSANKTANVYQSGVATYIDKSATAGNYCPTVRYYFLHNQASFFLGGSVQTADIDSNGNIYIIYSKKILLKFNTANQIEWAISIVSSDSPQIAPSSSTMDNDLKVETIDGVECLLLSLRFPMNSSGGVSPTPFYVMKLPLDIVDYTGTYGSITLTQVGQGIGVSSSATNPSLQSLTLLTGSSSLIPSSLTNTQKTATVTTEIIE
ncbi:hypothetical protein OAA60_02305 [Porticoccaceae bacterium]|nr:hypothetical protein [Porticoccaceae bacterium]